MTPSNPFLDEAGEQVVRFMGDVRTLGKIGELADKIIAMAESGAWQRYRTAVGTDEWLESEFDYFLIACDVDYDDVHRAIKWHKLGDTTRAMMDHDAGEGKRRTLEEAAAAYHAPGPETLIEAAARLHWVKNDGSPRSPLSPRQRARQATGGKTFEEQARERRRQRLAADRRRELDELASETVADLTDDEARYLFDKLGRLLTRGAGRPQADHEQWARDIAELDGDTRALADRWGVSIRTAQHRAQEIRE